MVVRHFLTNIIYGAIISIALIIIGLLISYVIIGDRTKIDLTLFILGGIPIIFFLPGVFSSSQSGSLHTPKVFFRKVGTLEQSHASERSTTAEKNKFISPAAIVLAGLFTWLIGSML